MNAPEGFQVARRALRRAKPAIPERSLSTLQRLSESGEYVKAAHAALTLLQDHAADIRALTHLLVGSFLEQGPEALPRSLTVLCEALTSGWDRLGPEARKPRVTDSALSWALKIVNQQIDFHEHQRDALFETWLTVGAERVGGPALEAAARLRAAIHQMISNPRSTQQLTELEVRVRSFFNRPLAVAPIEEPTAPGLDFEAEASFALEAAPAEAAHSVTPASAPAPEPTATPALEISPPMAKLIQKLEAFEILVERGDMARAALVAHDLQTIFESFDPRAYFPQLLSPFFQLLHRCAEPIAMEQVNQHHPARAALEQLYRIDFDAFMAVE